MFGESVSEKKKNYWMTNHQKSVFGTAKRQLKTINNKNQKNKVNKTKITRKKPTFCHPVHSESAADLLT